MPLLHTVPQRSSRLQAFRLPTRGEVVRQGMLPDVDHAATHHRQALADALGLRPLQAHCHRDLGLLYAATGQREQARIALSTARAMYQSMEMGSQEHSASGARPWNPEMTFWLPETEAVLAQVEGR